MNTLLDPAKSVEYHGGEILVTLESGQVLQFPVADNPRLSVGTPEQLNRVEISPYGLHWPDLDEDLSLSGIARGDYGQEKP